MGGKGDNKHSFSSERINNVMSRFIKLYTHNDTGHNSCKDTDNKPTHNNTRNGNLVDISDKARKCSWRNTNNDTRNICVMLYAIKTLPTNDVRNITDDDATNNTHTIPVKILAIVHNCARKLYPKRIRKYVHNNTNNNIYKFFRDSTCNY